MSKVWITGPGKCGTTLSFRIFNSLLGGDPNAASENRMMVTYNEEIIRHYYDNANAEAWVRIPPPAERVAQEPGVFHEGFTERAAAISRMLPPVVKDPRLSITYPVWTRPEVKAPEYLIVLDRDPDQMSRSWGDLSNLERTRRAVDYRRERLEDLCEAFVEAGAIVYPFEFPHCFFHPSAFVNLMREISGRDDCLKVFHKHFFPSRVHLYEGMENRVYPPRLASQ